MHHRLKVDAPSGTALMLGKAAAEGRRIGLEDHCVRVRNGQVGVRKRGDIGFATLRGGDVIGDHSVISQVPASGSNLLTAPATGSFSRAARSRPRFGAKASRPASIRCRTCLGSNWQKDDMDNLLVLVRHGESEWNKLNLYGLARRRPVGDRGGRSPARGPAD